VKLTRAEKRELREAKAERDRSEFETPWILVL